MLDLENVLPDRSQHLYRRVVAAIPEAALAYACYTGAMDALAGVAPGLYLYGLIAIELLGLAWLRLALAPIDIASARSWWRRALGIGGTGIALAIGFFNAIFVLLGFLFVMLFEPRTFVLLLLALTRRSLWQWAWAIRSVDDARLLHEHMRRAFRAHGIALACSFAVGLAFHFSIDADEGARERLGDALWLAGMAGYFVALAIYLLFGRAPLAAREAESAPAMPATRLAPVDLAYFGGIARTARDHWPGLIPGVLLLAFFMEVVWQALDAGVQVMAAPLGIGLSGWLLVGGAARALGITAQSGWEYGFPRLVDFVLRSALLWFGAGVLVFLAVPVTAGIFDVELRVARDSPALESGFYVALVGILYLLARLWPLVTYPFAVAVLPAPAAIPYGLKDAWRMTAGVDGFLRGALPPFVAVAGAIALLSVAGDFIVVAKAVAYVVLAPLIALMAVERTAAMAAPLDAATPDAAGESETAAQARPARGEAAPDMIVPLPLPVPAPRRQGVAAPQPEPAREHYYSKEWSDLQVYGSALYNEDIPTATRMLDKGVPLDSEISDGDPALLWAARMGKPVSFRFLLDRGADVYGRARLGGASVLHIAAAKPVMVPFLPELLQWGEPIDQPDSFGQSPLLSACRAGCIEGARLLLARGADPRLTDKQGSSALHHFVDRLRAGEVGEDQLGFIRELLAAGLDPLAIGAYGRHAVSLAAERGLDQVLALFRDAGSDLSRPDRRGLSAVNAAAVLGQTDTARGLLAAGESTDFHGAIMLGDRAAVAAQLAERAARANETLGETKLHPLALAVKHGHAQIVRQLLAAGADPRQASGWGGSILHNAVRHLPDPEILAALVEHGAEVDALDGDMNTPLNFAARDDALEAAEFLLRAGADPNAKTERGYAVSVFAKSERMKALLRRHGGA
ncbi:MAG: ankyrin repeat domain-containing protein [Burkholderiales bacterium]